MVTDDDERDGGSLRDLVAQARGRDPDAWEQLYRRSYRRLFGFARRRLLDDRAAEDAVSETMARALDAIDRFAWQGGGFDAWLYGIARNVVYELGRARKRTVALGAHDAAAAEGGPEERAIAGERSDDVRRAFDRLEPAERELLELRVQAGLSSEEVGQLLGKKAGAVRMAQARALGRLRTMLEGGSG